jgi:methyl-accepting chemotaxis protein
VKVHPSPGSLSTQMPPPISSTNVFDGARRAKQEALSASTVAVKGGEVVGQAVSTFKLA